MTKLVYRLAGIFCLLFALILLGGVIYFPFFTIMAPQGKMLMASGGLAGGGFFGFIGANFLIKGGPV